MQHLERVKKQPNDDENQTQELMKDIKHNIRPTHIIVEDGMCQSIENYKNRCPYSDGCFCNPFQRKECTDWKKNYPFFRKEPLIKSMIKKRLLHKVMFSPGRKLNVWFKVKNFFLDECCVMTSISATNIKHFGKNFKKFLYNLRKTQSTEKYKILIIGGSHGSEEGHDVMDNLTHFKDEKGYRDTCELIGWKYLDKYLQTDEPQPREGQLQE